MFACIHTHMLTHAHTHARTHAHPHARTLTINLLFIVVMEAVHAPKDLVGGDKVVEQTVQLVLPDGEVASVGHGSCTQPARSS